MSYFVTGATGFIGKHLVDKLSQREGQIFALVRPGSEAKFEALQQRLGSQGERLQLVSGDIGKKNLGLSAADLKRLKSADIQHVFHLAALYDLDANLAHQEQVNVQGTAEALAVAKQLKPQCFHMMSSIAVAGLYPGVFREDMFDEAGDLEHPYFYSKHAAEALVREQQEVAFRIYRPGMVIGHSESGEIDKIDGPYYFFKLIQKFRKSLPPWVPTIGLEGGYMNVVPVDYVAAAVDHIAHQDGLESDTFHLTDPKPLKMGEVLNIFAAAGHAPKMALRLDTKLFGFVPEYVRRMVLAIPAIQRIKRTLLQDLGIPESVLELMDYPTRFDSRETEKALAGSGIRLPDLRAYAAPIWDYWERHLDPDLFVSQNLQEAVKGKVILLTGGTSGIGLATAMRMADAETTLVLVARKEGKLEETKAQLESMGPIKVAIYRCDISNLDDCGTLIDKVIADHGQVDVLINNAGRSIRRSVEHSIDRFHDYERTMQLNYFACLKLIMGVLPHMAKRRSGHIINVSSIGVLTNAPRFSAYVASKGALEAFTRCAAAEYSDTGVRFTTVNMPLVDTPMIAPTKIYQYFPTLSPEQAADLMVKAVVNKPKRVATRLGIFIQVLYYLAPKVTEIMFNFTFRLFKDSAAASGDRRQLRKALTSEQIAVSQFMKGIHL